MKKLRLSALAAAIAITSASPSAVAAGFQIAEHSANGLGRAFAGESAMAENAAVLAHNPAAMSQFDKTEFSVVLSHVIPKVELEGQVTNHLIQAYNNQLAPAVEQLMTKTLPRVEADAYQANASDIAPDAFIPAFYLISPLSDKLHVGLGIFSNFGLSTEYEDDFNALEYADDTELTTININPSISYKLTNNFTLGFGINAVYADAALSTTTPNYFNTTLAPFTLYNTDASVIDPLGTQLPQLPVIPGNIGLADVKGDGWAWGWNAGIFWEVTDKTDVALSYRSAVDVTLEGDFTSQIQSLSHIPGSLDLNLPELAELAINHRYNDKLSVQASLNYTGWSSFEKLEIDLDNIGAQLLKEENFKNAWRASLGTTYLLDSSWTLRAGIALDKSPVRDEFRTISIPDADRKWVSAGTTYTLSEKQSIDFGLTYITGDSVDVNEEFKVGEATITSLDAKLSQVDIYIWSIQYNHSF